MSDTMIRRGLTPVINACGTMTSLGASRVAPEVAAEVADMLGRFVLMHELHAQASAVIARVTDAEAGVVTSSSASAITLCVAAAIAGDDLAAIEALPATGRRERRVAIQMGHMINYGAPVPQAIATAGAEVVPLGTACLCETYHLEAALTEGLAAAIYVVSHHTVREGELPMDVFIDLCRRRSVPAIVDMASEYDLHGAVRLGADAVIWSGHKFLAGTTSGIVAGPRRFMRAVYLQNRGLGRLMKVGKEGLVGAIAALEAWEQRDHDAERARETAITELWLNQLAGLPGITAALHDDWTGNPIARVELSVDPVTSGLHAWELSARLLVGNPAIALRDDLAEHQLIYLDPCNVTLEEARQLALAIRTTFEAARKNNDGCRLSWSDEKRRRGTVSLPWLDGGAS